MAWDAFHPRAMLRLSDERLEQFITILGEAERTGQWPDCVGWVTIVMLPKPDGGHRPIGLFPTPIRIWMRLRREQAHQWEVDHNDELFYASAGRGADVAAWAQAARAEAAAAAGTDNTFAQLLLDLVKCFDLVPHQTLVDEARAVGYPLRLLRMTICAYNLPRTVSVENAFSELLVAQSGITAGSGFATTELRVLLYRLLKRIEENHPHVRLVDYVDDVSAEAVGEASVVRERLHAAGLDLCLGLQALGLRLSESKCKVMASSDCVAADVAHKLRMFGFKAAKRARSLGVGLGAGVRRNTQVQASRFKAFKRRLGKFVALLRSGVNVARILRTGGTAALRFGDFVIGVAPSVLRDRRRVVAAAAMPATRGRDVNMSLILSDDSDNQRLDPAYSASTDPIGHWAEAIWHEWIPRGILVKSFAKARRDVLQAKRPWSVVRGPAAAMYASALRIGWQTPDGITFTTDEGEEIDITLDPPIAVRRLVERSVRNWRWREVAFGAPHLQSDGHSGEAAVDPLRKLLAPSAKRIGWGVEQQSALRSAATNAQWPQSRLHKANLVEHPYCVLCKEFGTGNHNAVAGAAFPEPPQGTVFHRIFGCVHTALFHDAFFGRLAWLRKAVTAKVGSVRGTRHGESEGLVNDYKWAGCLYDADAALRAGAIQGDSGHDERGTRDDAEQFRGKTRRKFKPVGWALGATYRMRGVLHGVTGGQWFQAVHNTWKQCNTATALTRALVPVPDVAERWTPSEGTINWILKPTRDVPFKAVFYTDASAIDFKYQSLRRLAWAFVAYDRCGVKVAEANGHPPPWIRSVAGAEAWALYMATVVARQGSVFTSDCKAVVHAMSRGRRWATAANRPLARVFGVLFDELGEGDHSERVIWMPAHLNAGQIAGRIKSNGECVTAFDREANGRADELAKAAVKSVRASPSKRAAIVAADIVAEQLAYVVGRMTYAANHRPEAPHRDSHATRARPSAAADVAPEREPIGREARPNHGRSPAMGGHALRRLASGVWKCLVCWKSTRRRARISGLRCEGAVIDKWNAREVALRGVGTGDASSHARWMTGPYIWCSKCGAHARVKAVGLSLPCKGPPAKTAWGIKTVLKRLRDYRDPKTGDVIATRHYPEMRLISAATRGGKVAVGKAYAHGPSKLDPNDPWHDFMREWDGREVDNRDGDADAHATHASGPTAAMFRLEELRKRVRGRIAAAAAHNSLGEVRKRITGKRKDPNAHDGNQARSVGPQIDDTGSVSVADAVKRRRVDTGHGSNDGSACNSGYVGIGTVTADAVHDAIAIADCKHVRRVRRRMSGKNSCGRFEGCGCGCSHRDTPQSKDSSDCPSHCGG